MSNAGANQSLCKGASPYIISLHANTPDAGHGIGSWTRIWPTSDPVGTFSGISDPASTYTTSSSGLFIFVWTITDGYCDNSDETRALFGESLKKYGEFGPDLRW